MGCSEEAEVSGRVVDGGEIRSRRTPHAARVLMAVDWATSLLLLAPLCVLYWWSTWNLVDLYVLPGQFNTSSLVSVGLGYSICWCCNVAQKPLTSFLTDRALAFWWRGIVSRTYTILFAFGLVNEWRGVWQLLDLCFGTSGTSGVGSAAFGILALTATRTVRNVMAPPLGLATDSLDRAYAYSPTRFRTLQAQKSTYLFLLDVTFSVVVVGSLVVFVWRGFWTILDVFLFPDYPALSGFSSLAIGYAIVLLAYALQYPAAEVSRHLTSDIGRILWEDTFLLVACFGGINVWRGIWMFADVYILPGDPVMSNWVTHAVGMLGSILLFAGNTILARGVFLDGEFKDGSGCIFNTLYLRKILQVTTCRAKGRDGAVEMASNSKTAGRDKANGPASNREASDKAGNVMDGDVSKSPLASFETIEKESAV